MSFITINEIDRLLNEDVPYFDLTSHTLGIGEQSGRIAYFTREDAIICGTEEVQAIFERMHIKTTAQISFGQKVKAGSELISGTGSAKDLHIVWKCCQNILDHCSGVATKTRRMVDLVRAVNPSLPILTTRKTFPGTKALATRAIMAGGAMPHRLGLSESILIFKQHLNFIGGLDGLIRKLPEIKSNSCDKKILVEATNLIDAQKLCAAGVDGIQFDKLDIAALKEAVTNLRDEFPSVLLLAAGGINEANVTDFAKIDINGIITTSLYNARPIDVGVKIEPI